MSETSEVPQQVALSQREKHQAFKGERSEAKDKVLALSWKIATEPTLRIQLATNPYSPQAQALMTERFSDVKPADRVRALILGEPEGKYDREFKQLSREQQRDRLYEQIDTSANMAVRLSTYFNDHMQEFWELSHEVIYARLSEVAFDTADSQKVEDVYAQNQRRGFRLAIVNFIEGIGSLRQHRAEFGYNPETTEYKPEIKKAKVEALLGHTFEGNIEVEALPVGFVIYLQEEDYAKVEGVNDPKQITQAGVTLKLESLPAELKGKVIVINKGGIINGVRPAERMQEVRNHELRHNLFDNFFQEREESYIQSQEEFTGIKTFIDHQRFAQQLRKNFLLEGRDEIIAHIADHVYDNAVAELGADRWANYLNSIENSLWLRTDISPEEKVNIYNLYREQIVSAAEQLRTYQWVERKLFSATEQGESGLTRDKVEALLQLVPVDQIGRLTKYLHFSSNEITTVQKQEDIVFTKQMETFINNLASSENEEIEAGFEQLKIIAEIRPKQLMPAVLQEIQNGTDDLVVSSCITLVRDMIFQSCHTLSFSELEDIQNALKKMIGNNLIHNNGKLKFSSEMAERLTQFIETREQIDFVHNKPSWLEPSQMDNSAN